MRAIRRGNRCISFEIPLTLHHHHCSNNCFPEVRQDFIPEVKTSLYCNDLNFTSYVDRLFVKNAAFKTQGPKYPYAHGQHRGHLWNLYLAKSKLNLPLSADALGRCTRGRYIAQQQQRWMMQQSDFFLYSRAVRKGKKQPQNKNSRLPDEHWSSFRDLWPCSISLHPPASHVVSTN